MVTSPVDGGYSGYYWGSNYSKRWGTNDLAFPEAAVDDKHGKTDCWATIFDANGNNNEMQAATGDSGGGVFYKRGNSWELLGIMLAVDVGSNLDQPDGGLNMAVFGDTTYMADLSVYYGEITQVIPEPSTLVLLITGGVAGWLFWRRCAALR